MWRKGNSHTFGGNLDEKRQNLYDISSIWNLNIQQTSEYNKKETDSQI